MTNDFMQIVTWDAPPIHVAAAWLSLPLPVIVAVICVFLRRKPDDQRTVVAQRFFIALHVQYAFFAFCTTSAFLDNWLRFSVTMDNTSAAFTAMNHLAMSHLLWGIALQTTVSLLAALTVTFSLRSRPRLWEVRYVLIGIGLVACAELTVFMTFAAWRP